MIRLGYVGINTLLPTASRTFRIINYSEQKMLDMAKSNILSLENILHWNSDHDIRLFRITSNLIPYGSHLINRGLWKEVFKDDFERIGLFIKENNMTVSMHPGQYTVINSPVEKFYQNSIGDLEYHNSILDLMELDFNHKIIIHGGGGYNNKTEASNRLKNRIQSLPGYLKKRIVLENDERVFSAKEIIDIAVKVKLPAVFDVFHHEVFPSFEDKSLREIILIFKRNWGKNCRQKIHYSNQGKGKHKGAHSEAIDVKRFANFYQKIKDLDLDIMLETKDKEKSVLLLRKHFPELK